MKQPRKVLKAFLLLGISCAFSGCSAGSLPWKPHSNEQVQSAHRADAADHATIADSAKSSESAPLTAETAQSAKSAQEATNAVFAQTAGSATNANFATTAGSYMGTILPNQINDQLLDVQMSPRTAFQTKGVLDSYSAANLFGFPADKLAGTVPAGNLPANLVYTEQNKLPALDGTALSLNATNLTQGTIPVSALPSNVVLSTNNVLPALDASLLKNLSASQLSGTIGAPNLPANIVYSNAGQLPALDGSQLTNLPGIDPAAMCCRLSLHNTNAITTSDTTGSLIYLVPFRGNRIPLYNGTTWQVHLLSMALSVSPSPALNTVFDIFVSLSGGNLVLTTQDWSNDSTRAVPLALQDGVWVSSLDKTKRYLGTARTNSSGSVDDTKLDRNLWNYYHRVRRPLRVQELTYAWSYNTAAWRVANNATTNRVSAVIGMPEVSIHLEGLGMAYTTPSNGAAAISIGEDSTTTPHPDVLGQGGYSTGGSHIYLSTVLNYYPSIGFHRWYWLETGSGASGNTTYFYGNGPANTGGYNYQWLEGLVGSIEG